MGLLQNSSHANKYQYLSYLSSHIHGGAVVVMFISNKKSLKLQSQDEYFVKTRLRETNDNTQLKTYRKDRISSDEIDSQQVDVVKKESESP